MKSIILSYVIVVLFLVVGWVLNIVNIVQSLPSDEITLTLIFQILGVFVFPVGSLLGYIL